MPKAIESTITKLLKLIDLLSADERQAAIDILKHANRKDRPTPAPAKKARQKATQTAGEVTQ